MLYRTRIYSVLKTNFVVYLGRTGKAYHIRHFFSLGLATYNLFVSLLLLYYKFHLCYDVNLDFPFYYLETVILVTLTSQLKDLFIYCHEHRVHISYHIIFQFVRIYEPPPPFKVSRKNLKWRKYNMMIIDLGSLNLNPK